MKRSISQLKGIGPAKEEVLRDHGIETIEDLLYTFPRRYVDRTLQSSTAFKSGEYLTLLVTVENQYLRHGKRTMLIVRTRTASGEPLNLVFFQSAKYFVSLFQPGKTVVVSGKLEYRGGMQMAHPDFEFFDEEDEDALLHVGRIVPIYAGTDSLKKKGLDSRGLRRLIRNAQALGDLNIEESLPDSLIRKYNLMERRRALEEIHYPSNSEALEQARYRMKYEELFLFNALMQQRARERWIHPRKLWPLPFEKSDEYNELLRRLPFELTGDQKLAIQKINQSCQKDHPEAFLLQGDVGSGKTIVALGAALHYTSNKTQVAFMAPTDLLARQHFRTISDFLGLGHPCRIGLLTGQDRKKEREATLAGIATGEIDLIVGTHTLIEDTVKFHSIGLVIIDEQHRFGVAQRERLRAKGENPDMIAMTATPIPRSLCLTEFADLKLIVLKEKPAGRGKIKTMHLTEDRRMGMYKSVRKHVSEGRQCYIVYPIIEESEKVDLRTATDAFTELSTSIFPDFRVELIHGRLKAAERDAIMNEFRRGNVQILVSTTVIEVGVDVPNATIMVIEHAERFGISQLHQLRGRVGRGSEESFCILMADGPLTDDATERIGAMLESDDGFYLSEVDMRLRGPGELLGKRQHGLDNFRISDLVQDRDLAIQANEDARELTELPQEGQDFIAKRFSLLEESSSGA